jgi:Asp/Glu/hydantoin racemase
MISIKIDDQYPDVGAIVLECTNMPPYADSVRRVTGLPVFDAVTMVNHAYAGLAAGGF